MNRTAHGSNRKIRTAGTGNRRGRPGLIAAVAASAIALLGGLCTPAAAAPRTAGTATEVRNPAGCGQSAPQEPGSSALHPLTSGGLARTYQLHLPPEYTPDRGFPVVLAFHGRGNTGQGTEEFSKLSELPAIVAYPNGVVGTGDGERQAWQGAPYAAPGVDDVAFTDDLLDELERTLCVDRARVYATGKSNGAGFTGLLACRRADRITAVAPVAGAFYPDTGKNCRPSRPVPVIDFHGTGDATIPYLGDEERGLPAIRDWTARWASRNGCATRPTTETVAPDITLTNWTKCRSGADVRHVAVTDGGHTWPGADSYSGGGYTTQTIEAHEVLWDFVSRHRLPDSVLR
ncbi:alpha/beta hydrolase family esterase [Streptomyces sp. NBC_01304]|uniref:alpha/beta hydrolase family esterase n=1 Tax=Streptomyces sp. NBC_01304 TaxID=2903818 RepID=UPI002E1489FD|nr:ferulic acid esterase [Streptomyces sp. NBC_01304]